MRHAPAVSVLCHGRGWHGCQAAVLGLAAAVWVAWALSHLQADKLAGWLASCSVGISCAALAWRPSARLAVWLVWDGARWTANDQVMRVELMLDLADTLLIRLSRVADQDRRARFSSTWIGLSRREAGVAWHGLRVALYGQPRRAVDISAGPACP